MRICRFITQIVTKALISEGIPYWATESAFSFTRQNFAQIKFLYLHKYLPYRLSVYPTTLLIRSADYGFYRVLLGTLFAKFQAWFQVFSRTFGVFAEFF